MPWSGVAYLNTTAISFVDAPAATLGSYPEVSSFKQDFQVEGGLYDLLWSEASKEGVERGNRPRTVASSSNFVLRR